MEIFQKLQKFQEKMLDNLKKNTGKFKLNIV